MIKRSAGDTDGLVLEVLPAEEGDCLLLTCRSGNEAHHVLIDGGTPATAARLRARLERLSDRHLDLLVVTHIDTDHIGGMVRLLRDPGFDFTIDDVWFNGFQHLPRNRRTAMRGVADAERLSAILTGVVGGRALNWNSAFAHKAVMRAADDQQSAEDLPTIKFPWGLTVTVLSPSPKRLDALYTQWNRYLEELRQELPSPQTEQRIKRRARGAIDLEELAGAPSAKDGAAANGSSIAFLAEFAGRSCIFAADAYANVLEPALKRLARLREGAPADAQLSPIPLKVDVFKLPHHCSQANVLPELFKAVQADHYIVSTNGNRFNHPDDEAMARVITKGGAEHTIWFNYRSRRTERWDRLEWQNKYRYVTKYPDSDGGGITLTLRSVE